MNKDNLYHKWIHLRRQVNLPENFTNQVMNAIQNQRREARFSLFDRFGTPSHILTRWAAALGLIALGLYRIFFVTTNLLLGSTL